MHHLLVVHVPTNDADYAADLLWAAGAQAVEEVTSGEGVDLRTDLGDDPIDKWRRFCAANDSARSWPVSIHDVDPSVTDTWKIHASVTLVDEVRIVPAWVDEIHGQNDIVIDPGGAFGMGDHPTTRATLALALRRKRRVGTPSAVLDLGCGSGVLGIAMAKFFASRVVAADIAPAAIEATEVNARLNGVSDSMVIELGDVNTVTGTYDLVLANILAPVLLADHATIASRVTSHGGLVLSGFTASRRDDVEKAYAGEGLELVGALEVDGWYALEMERA